MLSLAQVTGKEATNDMQIDGNELAILQDQLDREGKKEEAWRVKQEFLRQVREAGDHCPCRQPCPARTTATVLSA